MATEISKRLFTVDDYQRMVDAGILSEHDRVELIHGEVLAMSPIGPPHNGTVIQASNALFPIVSDHALLGVQGSVVLDLHNQPQPDIFLLRRRSYTTQHAGPADIFLIIEIADSSLDYDQTVKAALYAGTGVPEYWIADINNDCVWVHTDIQDGVYRAVNQFHRGESITPKLLPGCIIP